MSNSTLLPAIRSHVGDWTFYVTTLSFKEVKDLIKDPDEIHERKRLSEWIQREAIDSHSEAISNYILENEQRFLGSLIVGVYDGTPNWASFNVDFSTDPLEITEDQISNIEGKLGFLHFSGEEKLFAIDGQHRVAGIKQALESSTHDTIKTKVESDSVSAIFVAHNNKSTKGKQRTRRLFTTVNKKAKRIGDAGIIALDEDNGFAVVTRRLIDSHWLFEDKRNHISYTSNSAIQATDKTTITSIVGLYQITQDLYPHSNKKDFGTNRPSNESLDEHLKHCSDYLDILISKVSEYKEVFKKNTKTTAFYRKGKKDHLLFRPIGQRAFARSVQLLMKRGDSMKKAISTLLKVNLYIDSKQWHHILWNPIDKVMIFNKLGYAETRLLTLAGKEGRNKKNEKKLKDFIDSIPK